MIDAGQFNVNVVTGAVTVNTTGVGDPYFGFNDGDLLRAAGGAYIRTADGDLNLVAKSKIGEDQSVNQSAGLSLNSLLIGAKKLNATSEDRAEIFVISMADVDVGNTGGNSRGGQTKVLNLTGTQKINSAVDAAGEDIEIVADDVELLGTVRSAGGDLTIRGRRPTNAMVIGDLTSTGYLADRPEDNVDFTGESILHISRAEVDRLEGGFDTVKLGKEGGSNGIWVVGTNPEDDITFKDSTELNADGIGGEIWIGNDVAAPDLVLRGSGNTTTLAADVTTNIGDLTIADSARVLGDITLTAAADIVVGRLGQSPLDYLSGDSAGTTDHLTLAAAGNITFETEIGRIVAANGPTPETDLMDSLTITNAVDVTFNQDMVINGDVVITASGTVTFNGDVTIQGGGDLRIFGASEVIFASGHTVTLTGGGDIELETDQLKIGTAADGITGTGEVILRQTSLNRGINIGLDAEDAGVLSIAASEMAAFADGFSQYTVGHEALNNDADLSEVLSSTVKIGAIADGSLFNDDLDVFAGAISFEHFAATDRTFMLAAGQTLNLTAQGAIDFFNQVEADTINVTSHQAASVSVKTRRW